MEEALRELGKVIGFKESIAESFSTLSYIVYRKVMLLYNNANFLKINC